ncbi:MAG: hypothetical protein ABWY77_00195 [Acidimicrobiia bacterium]
MHVRLRITNALLLVTSELVALAWLVRIGDRRPFALGAPVDGARLDDWRRAAPFDALAAALRAVAVAVVVWLLLVTMWSVLAACAHRAPRRLHVGHGPLGDVQRWIERMVVTGLIAGALVGPSATTASAATEPPAVTIVRDGHAGSLDALPSDTHPSDTRPPETRPSEPPPTTTGEVIVAKGDNLWEIAAREVARTRAVSRRELTDADVVRYWSVVCELNRSRLASGDVNLIEPGEVVLLPAV